MASKQPIVEDVKDKKMPTVIVFDLETTGLSKERDRIVEIACVDLSDVTSAASVAGDGTDIKNFQTLVNPGRFSIPSHVQKLTGITNAMVSAPDIPSFQMAAERFEEFIEAARLKNKESGDGAYSGEVLLAAHNARQFDSSFLQRVLETWPRNAFALAVFRHFTFISIRFEEIGKYKVHLRCFERTLRDHHQRRRHDAPSVYRR